MYLAGVSMTLQSFISIKQKYFLCLKVFYSVDQQTGTGPGPGGWGPLL